MTVLPAASGHSGLILHEQVNIVEVHGDHDDHDDHGDHDDYGDHGDHGVAVFAMVFRKHFRSRKKFRWGQGEGCEVVEVEDAQLR